MIADDILCFGCGDTEAEAIQDHDRNLVKLLLRARSSGLKFNKSNIKFRLSEMSHRGQLLNNHGLKPDPRKVSYVVNMPVPEDRKAEITWSVQLGRDYLECAIILQGLCLLYQRCVSL